MRTTPNHTPGSQGRRPAGKGEDRREHILDNALTLFAGQGIAGTTVAQIAKASGVTSAMVHYYFSSREGLLDSLVAERLAPALEYLWAGVSADAPTDPRRFVTDFADRLLETVRRMPQLPLLWSREILNAGGMLRERLMTLIPPDKPAKAQAFLSAAQQSGELNPEVAPALVLTSVMGLIMLPLATRDVLNRVSGFSALDAALLRRHALALLLDGLCPARPRPEYPQEAEQ